MGRHCAVARAGVAVDFIAARDVVPSLVGPGLTPRVTWEQLKPGLTKVRFYISIEGELTLVDESSLTQRGWGAQTWNGTAELEGGWEYRASVQVGDYPLVWGYLTP